MTTKHVALMHEVRMWIGQVVIPAAIGGITLMSNPFTRAYIDEKICDMKTKIRNIKNHPS